MDDGTAEQAAFRDEVAREIDALAEDVLWTEKAHFAHAEGLARLNFWVGIVATVSASLAAATVVAQVLPWLTGVTAVAAAITAGLLTLLKPQDMERQHLDSARKLGALRVRMRQVRRIDMSAVLGLGADELRTRVSELAEQKAAIDRESPGTSGHSFNAARRKIEAGHFEHAGDGEA